MLPYQVKWFIIYDDANISNKNEKTANRKKKYHLKTRQLNNLKTSSPHHPFPSLPFLHFRLFILLPFSPSPFSPSLREGRGGFSPFYPSPFSPSLREGRGGYYFFTLLPLKASCMSVRHSSSSTPPIASALGWSTFGA